MPNEKEIQERSNEMKLHVPDTLPVVPLRNTVFFPRQVLPISVGREKSLRAVEEAQKNKTSVLVIAQRDGNIENPIVKDLYSIGTVAQIVKVFNLPDGTRNVLLQGASRARVLTDIESEEYNKATIQLLEDEHTDDIEIDALVTSVRNVFHRMVDLSQEYSDEHLSIILNLDDAAGTADIAAALMSASVKEKQRILETLDVKERLQRVHRQLNKIVQRLEIGSKIQSDVQEEIKKNQREYYLRQQLKAIQKELGENDEEVEIREFRERMEKAKLPDDVRQIVEKELNRLSKMHTSSAEYTVTRTYVEWLLDLPWSVSTEDNLDIDAAEKVLDRDHYGLEKVKKRILEYLSVRKLKNDMRGPILCFVGPPGVGKTSLGKSIANALGRKFIRMSLGGVRD